MLPSELWKAKHIQDAYRDISASFFLLEEVLSGFFVATAPSLLLAALLLWFATLLVFVTRFNFIKSEVVKYKKFFLFLYQEHIFENTFFHKYFVKYLVINI